MQTPPDLVSVIIPCYQQGRFLRECVSSLQAQSYPNWEAIIVNDGSTDNTEMLALQLVAEDTRVQYFHKQNGGLSSARNTGLAWSRGQFIQYLDADDQIEKCKLEVHVSALQKLPEIGVVYGNSKYYTDGHFGDFRRRMQLESVEQDWIADSWRDSRSMFDKILERNIFPVTSPLLRKVVAQKVGLFNESLPALEDWEYWVRCSLSGVCFQFVTEPNTDALIRIHGSNMTQNSVRMKNGEFLSRLACQNLLPVRERRVRTINLWRLVAASSALDSNNRNDRYSLMRLACKTFRERSFIKLAPWFESRGLFSPFARKIIQKMPRWLRRLLGMG